MLEVTCVYFAAKIQFDSPKLWISHSGILQILFEGVPEDLKDSNFVWKGMIEKYCHLKESLEAVGVLLEVS